MKLIKFYRNLPIIDNNKFFHFQRFKNRFWIEIPFVGITFKLS